MTAFSEHYFLGKHITYFLFMFLSLSTSQQYYHYVQKSVSSGFTTCSDLWKPKTLTINYFFMTLAQINGILRDNINITPPHWQQRNNLRIRGRGHYLLGTG